MHDFVSSNTWVGAGRPYQPGPNSQDTGETVVCFFPPAFLIQRSDRIFRKSPMGRDLSPVGAFAHIVLFPLLKNGQFKGEEFTDDVTINGMSVQGQSIGVASSVRCSFVPRRTCFTRLVLHSRLDLMELTAFSGRSLMSTLNISYPTRRSSIGPTALTQGTHRMLAHPIQIVERTI